MIRIATLLGFSCLLAGLSAQQTLKGLEQRFRKEVSAKARDRAAQSKILDRHVGELRTFLKDTAKGDDRWNGRLWLADLELVRGQRDAAKTALMEIDVEQAPAMVLVTAATLAQHLQLVAQRDAWIAKAVTLDAPLIDRMAMARLLMTVLREVEKGEAVFENALANARQDEDRAFVKWHRADALRDREDLPENTGFDELEKLAQSLPNTYWGSVAKDRLRATRLRVGDPAIDIAAKSTNQQPIATSKLLGKAVVLTFFTAADYDAPRLFTLLGELQKKHPDLAIIGISLDRDPAEIDKAIKELNIGFPVIGDGKGPETDAALRWFVEGPVVHVLDKSGKVAGLGLQAGTNDGRKELTEVIQRALR
jgi:peroxiredoxin